MRHTTWWMAAAVAAGMLAPPAAARADEPLERFTAFAVDMGGVTRRSGSGVVDIVIDRWSTPQEVTNLTASLREDGTEGLLKTLRKASRVGYIRSGTSLGYPLRFAHQLPLPGGGRRLLIATDRPISFLELRNRPRTVDDYPFMVIDVRIGPNGEGDGKLLPVARIEVHPDNVIEVENYLDQPVRLTKVRKAGD